MEELISLLKDLKRNRKLRLLIKKRLREFKNNRHDFFSELCFCILTANTKAERCISIQQKLKSRFLRTSHRELARLLRKAGYRYPVTRAEYIILARNWLPKLKEVLCSSRNTQLISNQIRDWLVRNIKGLGYKEASHFLRNIGFNDLAIIDIHILRLLQKYKIIRRFVMLNKRINKKTYLKIENKLRDIANRLNISLAELDLYLWFLETGKVLK